eukprot:CAMPEP_0172417174 /NCGR_PEP_ID=MMETSP1064-20121228/3688_1 /TAXON_ID=202472 /ORGANISM="Aulacoseira subarctica , Strain CCAP 1002/5" /LENGTH=334 /DNA_ID=CAMNT_0013155327 /DNA_START=107 /DNA_END=1111 /DNA_ORIENTATION=-
MSTSATSDSSIAVVPGRPSWQQTMLRIRNPEKSIKFYTDNFGMTLLDKFDFPKYSFTLYFLTTLPEGEEYNLKPGTQEAHEYLWSMDGVALELTYNYDPQQNYHPGNQERDGFGHIAFNVEDVYDATDRLLKAGIEFKKKPDEGRMKGLAFAYDPDGYWVEIVQRPSGIIKNYFNLSQTMIRVKDPKKSLAFYRSLGMKLVRERHYGDFSNYFLASSSSSIPETLDPGSEEANHLVKSMFHPILELTHNHGTEKDESFQHYNGNEEGRQGFGHIGFLVDDVYKACDAIRSHGYGFRKEPDGGSMKGLAFAYDPDGYSVEIIKRGGIDFGDLKVT